MSVSDKDWIPKVRSQNMAKAEFPLLFFGGGGSKEKTKKWSRTEVRDRRRKRDGVKTIKRDEELGEVEDMLGVLGKAGGSVMLILPRHIVFT